MSSIARTIRRGGAVLVTTTVFSTIVAVAPSAPAAHASYTPSLSTFDARLLADINHARAARGIRQLVVVAGTTDVAHGWSCHEAAYSLLAHNLHLASALDTHGSSSWTTYGENVGMQSSTAGADSLFRAYMNSPAHRANILDRSYKYVGIWTKQASGLRFNTVDFVGSTSTSYNFGYGSTRRTC